HPPQHHGPVFCGGRVPDIAERRCRTGLYHAADVVTWLRGTTARGLRSPAHCSLLRSAGHRLAGAGWHARCSLPGAQSFAVDAGGSPEARIMLRSILSQAGSALRHDRRRAFLTMLGMAWGIATVVLLLSYGEGFERAVMLVFASFGNNAIGVFPGRTTMQAGGAKAGTQIRFTLDDVDHTVAEVPGIKRITPTAAVS